MDLNLEPDDDLTEGLRERFGREVEELRGLLQRFIDDLCAALWQRYSDELTYQFSEKGLQETMFLQEGRFTPDGEFLDYDDD